MRQRSAKKAAKDRELDAVTPLLVVRSGGRCEFVAECYDDIRCEDSTVHYYVDIRCDRPAVHRHHIRMRSQGGDHSLENLLHVCNHHHRFIHLAPKWSYEHGYLAHAEATE